MSFLKTSLNFESIKPSNSPSVKKSCLLYITGAIRPSQRNQMNLPGVQQIRGALFLDMVVNKQGQTITTI